MDNDEEKQESVSPNDIDTKDEENEILNPEPTKDETGESRFSDDGVETEIEVSPESINGDVKKKKKRKKKGDESDEQDISTETKEEKEKLEPNNPNGFSNPAYTKSIDDVQVTKSETKKEQYKTQLKKMKTDPCYPFYLIIMCKICVLLPIAIYSCDVIIGVNVLEDPELGLNLVKHQNNFFNGSNAPLLTVIDHPYYHRIQDTVLYVAQRLSKERARRQAAINESETENTDELTTRSVELTDTTRELKKELSSSSSAVESTVPSLLQTIVSANEKTKSSTESATEFSTESATESATETATESETVLMNITRNATFCESERHFIEQHQKLSNNSKSSKETEYDWYISMNSELFKYQQALFFMFTVIGFLLLLSSIGTRVDAMLNEKWSSSLLIIFLFYTISMSLTAKVFALQSGANGVRCFLCQMVSFCNDIDPWNLTPDVYFPTNLNWNIAAFVSIILKIYDCFVIGIVTLKYVIDTQKDAWWVITLKIFGWILVFPFMIVTPLAGVIRYSVLPVTVPEDLGAKLAFETIFYIGVAFWAVALAILPFFCKMRMCNRVENYEEEEEYY